MKSKKSILTLILCMIFIAISSTSAVSITDDLHLNIQTTNSSGSVVTGTFNFTFNISTSSNCANIVYSNITTLITDSRGIISYYLPNVTLNYDQQYWLCYYRDGTLINASKIARVPYTFTAKNISAEGIKNDSNLNIIGYNITGSSGLFSWLGSLASRITKLFVQDIDFTGNINGSGNITTTGYIGIGTESPIQNLHVIGDANITGLIYGNGSQLTGISGGNPAGTEGAIQFYDNGNFGGNASQFFINKSSGNVGIGTTTPSNKLDVRGNVSLNNTLYVLENGDVGIGRSDTGNTNTFKVNGSMTIGKGVGGSLEEDNDAILGLSRSATAGYSMIIFQTGSSTTDSWTIGMLDGETDFAFDTGYGGGTGKRLVIQNTTGNVGIGTSNPTEKLMVNGSLRIQNSSGTLALYVNESTGNVGVGTSSPSHKLNVVGDANITGTLYANVIAGESLLNVNNSDYLDGYDSTFFMPLNTSVSGNFDFNGGWLNNGLSIIGGDIFAKTGYFYNISSLQVNNLNINGSLVPYTGFDNIFDIGSSSLRWRDLFIGRNARIEGIANFSGTIYINNATNMTPPTCSGTDKLTFSGNQFSCAADYGSGGEGYAGWNLSGNNIFTGASSYNVGINVLSPTEKLMVNGSLRVQNSSGTLALYVNESTGNVGIGVTNPNYLLEIANISSGRALNVSGVLYVNSTSGNVGIGTSSPTQKLHVLGYILSNNFNATGEITTTGVSAGYSNTGNYLTATGYYAGRENTGNNVVAIGYGAGYLNTRDSVTATGYQAGQSNLGFALTATGRAAGFSNTGDYLTATGYYAGYSNKGNFSTAIGYQAGQSNTGNYLTAIGYEAGYSNTGNSLTATGYEAGDSNKGNFSTATGFQAGYSNTGNYLTATGYSAGRSNTGNYLTATGLDAGYSNTGNYLTATGYEAGAQNTGNNVVAIGYYAGYLNTGNDSTVTGMFAGYSNKGNYSSGYGYEALRDNTANNVVAIGYQAGKDNAISDQFIVKQANVNAVPLIQGNFSSGYVGIGTTNPSNALDVRGTGNFSGTIYINNATDVSTLGGGSGGIPIVLNNSYEVYFNQSYPTFINISNLLFVNKTSGFVGINTTNPTTALHVAGTLNVTNIVLENNCAEGQVLKWSAQGLGVCGYDDVAGYWNLSGTNLSPASTAYNVGIGTTNPTHKLNVVGTSNFTDNAIFGNNVNITQKLGIGNAMIFEDGDMIFRI